MFQIPMFLHQQFFKSVDRKVTRMSVLVYTVKEKGRVIADRTSVKF